MAPSPPDRAARAPWSAAALAMALPCCALFTPTRAAPQCPEVAQAARARRPAGPAAADATAAPPRAPSPAVSEVVAARGFRLRRGMTLAVAPVAVGPRDLAFELLQRMLARRAVRVLDLSRAPELVATLSDEARDRGTTLEGPWLAAVWAARWGGASHILVSDGLTVGAHGADALARGRFRVLALPGAEVVWTGHFARVGDRDEDAVARDLDALVDALHGTLRDEPDPETAPASPPPSPAAPNRHRHRRSRHR